MKRKARRQVLERPSFHRTQCIGRVRRPEQVRAESRDRRTFYVMSLAYPAATRIVLRSVNSAHGVELSVVRRKMGPMSLRDFFKGHRNFLVAATFGHCRSDRVFN